ncbi:MAG: hypothetical protein KH897_19345 [Bacteroides sp.]|uniref:hypothetical protein n=1 Tax=Bacteroides sp. TaxID=29523 RepID=UPI0025BD4D28|nr:hypothetical protein [Bacteroides sp.]MBS6240463.1 hypothetical protein [Bacteroides sp.]
MNLDEMKNSWNVLNERLEQNEILNKRIIEEMVASKTKSAYDSIYNQELRGLYIILLCGLIVLPVNRFLGINMKLSSFILLETVMFLALLFQLVILYSLSKFKLNYMKVNELTRTVLKYRRFYSYNKKYGTILGLGSVIVFMISESKITNPYAFVPVLAVMIVGCIYSNTKMKQHEQKIKEVEQGLAELKEFESETIRTGSK